MNANQCRVWEFHRENNHLVQHGPEIPDRETQELRISLIQEELNELKDAFSRLDIVDAADAIADLLYVVYGTAVSCGIDIEPIFREVHRSNMTKSRGEKRADGKQLKGPGYQPPELVWILFRQSMHGTHHSGDPSSAAITP